MKNHLLTAVFLAVALFANNISAQELFRADFETFDSTPYYFRFGNKGSKGQHTYKPRWMYSHQVVDNPVKDAANPSDRVLEYTSMEARNYGLKFRFVKPLSIDELKTISFRIYQPANVIAKEVESAHSTAPATKQNLTVKLLSYFNTVNDFNQDDGILLYKTTQEFSREGEWVDVDITFEKSEYASQLSKFTKGVLGLAILPTYDSDVTLKEANRYVCYLDDITINKTINSVESQLGDTFTARYTDGKLQIESQASGICQLSLYTMDGKTVYRHTLHLDTNLQTLPLRLPTGIYILKCEQGNEVHQSRIIAQ